MRQQQRSNLVAVLLEVGKIRRDNVDPKQFRIGEHHAGVDHDDVVSVPERHRVHAELAETSERHDLKLAIRHLKASVA